jgi:ABC-type bacteriocin/lantibiotic exporter with double-glycine peptidase domain
MASDATHLGTPTPYRRLLRELSHDKRDLWALLLYTVMTGLLSLATPLAAQALVNTIAAGVFIQPLVVLALGLFVGLLFAGVLRVSQFYLVEIMQQRVFARVALNLAQRIPRIQHKVLAHTYLPELVNRFFDVINQQKSLAKLLLNGPAAVLQIVVGLVLMAFYSPLLLGFDIVILVFMAFIAFGLGSNGVRTSIAESLEKYRVAGWLEELARCQTSLKIDGDVHYLFNKTDSQVSAYLDARHQHFRILYRQVIASMFFQAVASAGILGIGGWLVINQQLTLGQLVASELVVVMLLGALDKLVAMFQDWYDLLTSVDKIGHLMDLPIERITGADFPESPLDKTINPDRPQSAGVSVVCRGLHFYYLPQQPILNQFDMAIAPGERVSLVGVSSAGKSTLAELLCGLLEPKLGVIEVNGLDIRQLNLACLRQAVALVTDSNELFDGTVEENILAGRANISPQDLRWSLDVTQLIDEISHLPQGLQTRVVSGGRNLSKGQIQRLMIARAIADHPQLLILDEAFAGMDESTKLRLLEALLQPDNHWTVLDISHDPDVVWRSDRILVLEGGQIQESGSPAALAKNAQGRFATLFPELSEHGYRAGFKRPPHRGGAS